MDTMRCTKIAHRFYLDRSSEAITRLTGANLATTFAGWPPWNEAATIDPFGHNALEHSLVRSDL